MCAKKAAVPVIAANPIEGKVKRLIISNFRSIGKNPITIDLDKIVVLVGPNNVGKSSILRAYESIMQDGSKDGHLSLEDFPNGEIKNGPILIELHTIVTNNPPASKWMANENGENLVKERWVWDNPGAPTRQGWNTQKNDWDENEVPWGAPNIANARRPQPHWVQAFDTPESQAEKINKLITTIITDKAKLIPGSDGSGKTEFECLLEQLKNFQDKAFSDAKIDITNIEDRLTEMVADVFADHVVNVTLHPPGDGAIKLFSAGNSLAVGHKNGWKGPLEKQGSGSRRTILWAVLKVLSEHSSKGSPRSRVLLIDEPELCLHPDAIREACKVLYDLAEKAGWQVIVTTHSPVFIDLSRDNTTVIRVERNVSGDIASTTLYRPDRTQLGAEDKENLKLLNIYDPYVAEFFFGGKAIVVEGDTEYSAFKYVINAGGLGKIPGFNKKQMSNLQIIRARGKATIVSLCKILNHFGAPYSVLHDTDKKEIATKEGKVKTNSAWTVNKNIIDAVKLAKDPSKIKLIASDYNFEIAFLGEETKLEKPYNAISQLSSDPAKLELVHKLLRSLVDHTAPLPKGAVLSTTLDFKETEEKAA